MLKRKFFILFVLIWLLLAFFLSSQFKNRDAYAADNELIEKLDQVLAAQAQLESEIALIRADLKEIKQKLNEQDGK